MNIEQARVNMIGQQIRPWWVPEQDVLNLLAIVKREDFVPAAFKGLAFADTEVPLPGGENMLKPVLEARILAAAAVKKHENVLEIGAGSGYMAALLSHKARHVTTVEIEPELKAFAEKNLSDYGIRNVNVAAGDGAQGWLGSGYNSAPYDVIVISGSMPSLPDIFLQQIKVGGRVLALVGEAPTMYLQIVTRISDTTCDTVTLLETCVKPLRNALTPSHFQF